MNMMRCSHCGWDNKERRLKCKKCNSILQYVPPTEPSDRKEEQGGACVVLPATDAPADMFEMTCIDCCYPMLPDAVSCPLCGAPARRDEQSGKPRPELPTRPNRRQPSFRMKRIHTHNLRKSQTMTFSGTQIILNRESVDPGNLSLSETVHAVLEYENNKWFIQDKSEHCTTFIRAASRTELKPGDVIVLGNQRFEFG